ncbi:MAG: GNAT family N-acetyltransferase, partial [Thermoanaerobaculia bacterium]
MDSQLIADQTYYLIESEGRPVACGGWSRRKTLFGGDQTKTGPDPLLDPAADPARVRAFFVDPRMARQ